MKGLKIVLEFQTKELTIDDVILLMKDINSLTMSTMDKAWAVNNSMAHKLKSKQEVTQCVVHILYAKYEKADLQSVNSNNCTHLHLLSKQVSGVTHIV
jgi:hypothetical protein